MKNKITVFILVFIIFWITLGLILFLNNDSNKKNLKNVGYSYKEIELINKKVSNNNNKYLINIGYNKHIIDIINHDNYIDNNLKEYINYYKKYKVNTDTIITWVNEYSNLNIEFNETTYSLLKQDYFLFNKLDRYLKYKKNNKNKSYKDIIKEVNSNLDKTFYVDINLANIEKKNLILVNKFNYLNNDYTPDNLVNIDSKYGRNTVKLNEEAYTYFKKMFKSANENNLNLYIRSGYRSYTEQEDMYNYYINNDDIIEVDKYSARPGFSEHQTGLAIDIIKDSTGNYDDFKNTKEFKWLQKNSYKYGFILRYPKDKEHLTGYNYEPWHFRYIGIKEATYIYEHDITFEEYYAYFVE